VILSGLAETCLYPMILLLLAWSIGNMAFVGVGEMDDM
jgi:hypothetical protein